MTSRNSELLDLFSERDLYLMDVAFEHGKYSRDSFAVPANTRNWLDQVAADGGITVGMVLAKDAERFKNNDDWIEIKSKHDLPDEAIWVVGLRHTQKWEKVCWDGKYMRNEMGGLIDWQSFTHYRFIQLPNQEVSNV